MDNQNKKKHEYPMNVNGKAFPQKPGLVDTFKEAFEPDNTKAQLEVMRRRKAKLESGG